MRRSALGGSRRECVYAEPTFQARATSCSRRAWRDKQFELRPGAQAADRFVQS
jgi:hypothetical protein